MEPAILIITLLCGMLVSRVGLPPLIGYLAAGFVLFTLGIEDTSLPILQQLADLGVTLLLFSIGLKLDLKSLQLQSTDANFLCIKFFQYRICGKSA